MQALRNPVPALPCVEGAASSTQTHMSRWKAAGIHLALSALIATAVVFAMYALWYPPPYFDLMGGPMLVVLIVGCDVVIGPLITLIIFRSGKKGLVFDLATIAFVQTLALSYGLYTMFEARPVFTVFAVDRFEVVAPSDINPEDLAKARSPEFSTFSLTGPLVVGTELPTDPKERNKLLFGELGADVKALPHYYVPYATVATRAAGRAKPLAELESKNPDAHEQIASVVARVNQPSSKLGYLPLVGRFVDMAEIIDTTTGQMLGVVDANPW